MPATETDLRIEQGTDWSHGWAVTVEGDAIDATWTARAQVRKSRLVTSELLHEFAAEVTAEGAVVLAVTPAESSAWDWTSGQYDVEITNADESLTLRVAQGRVTVNREVTA